MINHNMHRQLQIGLASPEQIRAWSERILPNGERVGEVTNPYALDIETNKPERDGLFRERIFGPKKTGVCACGKPKVIENEEGSQFCKHCGVELVDSRIRRYRMGYIKLACPVVHIWYFKRRPSYIANILDLTRKDLEGLVYCDSCITRAVANKPTLLRVGSGPFQYQDQYWTDMIHKYITWRDLRKFLEREITTGGNAIREKLAGLDLQIILDRSSMEWVTLEEEVPDWEEYMIRRRKDFLVRRMKLTKHFIQTKIKPEWMVLCLLPVLPPEPRPMFQLDEGDIITSDINELYRKLILRNGTLTKFLAKLFTPLPDSVNGQKRLIQEAVDALLDNGIGGQPVTDRHDRPYKSFSDLIQGKEGRFRENLLGKRVDYSGRSVIVVGPFLSLYQCGLPLEIAVELFQAFLIRSLIERHIAPNLRAAKSLIRDRAPVIWSVLKEVLRGYPLLLNRAPTLHRLGIQAFQPILIEGRAIRLHPLVCAGFNADFDGDQMAVHVPLSLEAQAEARLLMFSHRNLLSPATGDSLCVPTQDMLLGLYRSTLENNQGIYENKYHPYNSKNKIISPSFSSYEDALGAYQHKRIDLDSPLWLRWGRAPDLETGIPIINSVNREAPIEVQYEPLGTFYEIYEDFQIRKGRVGEISNRYIRTTVGRTRLNREIEEAMKGLWAYVSREMSL
uniref:RNA polymerase beta' subunit n=1 Tax=Podocarpus nubigenus TaxID=120627 RepID=UPI00226D1B03|nr:RNA polymerase beta' subunit [Podocarpus nubigenus]UZF97236.1 RNA polymerase beta' subunit [Podocarpus nubigenus]